MPLNFIGFSEVDIESYDTVVVGSGFAGAIAARRLADRANRRVLILEKRDHVGGNMYDEVDAAGIMVHRHGPHIFHTGNAEVWNYLQRFGAWREYEHKVAGAWRGTYFPIPFNLNSLDIVFPEELARRLARTLTDTFGADAQITVTDLRTFVDDDLALVANFVYENVFMQFTEKQWGLGIQQLDPSVIARVPIRVNRDDRAFTDAYQGIPASGYSALFASILDHPNIHIALGADATSLFDLQFDAGGIEAPCCGVRIKDRLFAGDIIYTGPLDELFVARFGRLPYRSIDFVYETHAVESMLPCATVNFIVSEKATRVTEFKKITGQTGSHTTLVKEYPCAYEDPDKQVPCYAILTDSSRAHHARYVALVSQLPNFHILGRLAEFSYYNMDTIVERALNLADSIAAGCTRA